MVYYSESLRQKLVLPFEPVPASHIRCVLSYLSVAEARKVNRRVRCLLQFVVSWACTSNSEKQKNVSPYAVQVADHLLRYDNVKLTSYADSLTRI